MRLARSKVIINKEVILKEAELLFAEKGFRAASIRDLAHATGLSHGAIYHHFRNKEEIFLTLLEQKLKELTPALKKAVKSKESVKERLIQMLTIYFSWEPEKRSMLEQGFKDIAQIEDSLIQNITQDLANEYKNITLDLLNEGVENGELKNIGAEILYAIFVGISKGVTTSVIDKNLAAMELARLIINTFFDGVKECKKQYNG